jgi:hypothetical protein
LISVVRVARGFADTFRRFDRLDVLVNAGAPLQRSVTEDGHETQFQVTTRPFLLTALLRGQLTAARCGQRVVDRPHGGAAGSTT